MAVRSLCSISQHCTIWRSDHCLFRQSTLYHMAVRLLCIPSVNTTIWAVRSLCIPSVNTVPYRGQIIVYFVSQHCTIGRSDHRVFHLSTLHYMAVRSLCIIPVNTIPHRHRVFRQSTLYHIAVRSLYILSVNTVPYGGQIIAYSICQHSTIWRSDHCVLFQSIQYHIVIVYSVSQQCTIWWSDRAFCQPVLKWLL